MMLALRKDWELTGNVDSLTSIVKAAYSLASRFCERTGAIRSWDKAVSLRYDIRDTERNVLVIIDSMCSKFATADASEVTLSD